MLLSKEASDPGLGLSGSEEVDMKVSGQDIPGPAQHREVCSLGALLDSKDTGISQGEHFQGLPPVLWVLLCESDSQDMVPTA